MGNAMALFTMARR
jgi:hypothetical protein